MCNIYHRRVFVRTDFTSYFGILFKLSKFVIINVGTFPIPHLTSASGDTFFNTSINLPAFILSLQLSRNHLLYLQEQNHTGLTVFYLFLF